MTIQVLFSQESCQNDETLFRIFLKPLCKKCVFGTDIEKMLNEMQVYFAIWTGQTGIILSVFGSAFDDGLLVFIGWHNTVKIALRQRRNALRLFTDQT